MTQYLLRQQNDEMWQQKMKEGRDAYWKETTSLLKKQKMKRKKIPETAFDKFKKTRFLESDDVDTNLEGCVIYDCIERCDQRDLDRLYDHLYERYKDNRISKVTWNVFENLVWNQGNDRVYKK
jgi:hypothetical protein